jgi:hypothetical protein
MGLMAITGVILRGLYEREWSVQSPDNNNSSVGKCNGPSQGRWNQC